ncbi:MAG: hypothetical protein EZS28_006859, partial [Streblomastix strix]
GPEELSKETILDKFKWNEQHSRSIEIRNRFEQNGVIITVYQFGVKNRDLPVREKSAVIIGQIYRGDSLPQYLKNDVIDILKNYIAFHDFTDPIFPHYFHILADLAWSSSHHTRILQDNFLQVINRHLQSPRPKNVILSLEIIEHLIIGGNNYTKQCVKKGIDFEMIKSNQTQDHNARFLLNEVMKFGGYQIEEERIQDQDLEKPIIRENEEKKEDDGNEEKK